MADIIIDLNFVPVSLANEPLLGRTLAKEVGELLCKGKDTSYCLEKYLFGKELYDTGSANFGDSASPTAQAMVAYFKTLCNEYREFTNEIKGQILLKFPA